MTPFPNIYDVCPRSIFLISERTGRRSETWYSPRNSMWINGLLVAYTVASHVKVKAFTFWCLCHVFIFFSYFFLHVNLRKLEAYFFHFFFIFWCTRTRHLSRTFWMFWNIGYHFSCTIVKRSDLLHYKKYISTTVCSFLMQECTSTGFWNDIEVVQHSNSRVLPLPWSIW